MEFCGSLSLLLTLFAYSLGDSIIYRDPIMRTETPVCGNGDFCNMEIRTQPEGTAPDVIYASRILTCRCQEGVTCPNQWGAHERAVFKHVYNSAENMSVTISYCEPLASVTLRKCRANEPVLSLRGYDIAFQLEDPVRCNCTRRKLFITSSRTDGHASIKTYSCGKPLCDLNRTNQSPCVHVFAVRNPIPDNGPIYREEYPCRCRFRNRVTRNKQECYFNPQNIPTRVGDSTTGICREIPRLED